MKTYLKTLVIMFKKHITRFVSLIFIVLVSIGFISGIGTSADKIKYSLTDYYKARNVSDLIIKNTSADGFSEEQISNIKDLYGESNVIYGASFDTEITVNGEKQLVRLCFFDGLEDILSPSVNVPEVTELVNLPETDGINIAYAEAADNKIKGVEAGIEIELDFISIAEELAEEEFPAALKNFISPVKVTVGGTVQSPLTFAKDGEPSWKNGEDTKVPDMIDEVNALITLENILYIPYSVIPEIPAVPYFHPEAEKLIKITDVYAAFDNRDKFNCFDKDYESYVEAQKEIILETASINSDDVRFISLYDNFSFVSLNSYADKVSGIGYVLMAAFLFVTGLVALSNMTRLMEEERGQIACLRTLGYSAPKIIFKYLLFAMIATGIGGVSAYFVGLGLAYLICYVFNYSFVMPPITSRVALLYFLVVFIVIAVVIIASTVISGLKMTGEAPANLLRPKPPKAGKKVFLERIPFIWNLLSFKYKSTMRNVLRYLSRFIMTVISVAVSTSLVMAGLSLLDLCLSGSITSPSIMGVAAVVIVFAGLLTAVVIYTLTNINVSERNRELATLKVLGYHEKEVSGYIFREVYVDTAIGIIFGYPLSALIITFIFEVIGLGKLSGISWYWWLVTPFVVLAFTFIVTLMLSPKILRIDMNESLKAIE